MSEYSNNLKLTSSANNLNYTKVTEESVTDLTRKSVVDGGDIDYGRQSILGRTKITKNTSEKREKQNS